MNWTALLSQLAHGCAIVFPYLCLLALMLFALRYQWVQKHLSSAVEGPDGRTRMKALAYGMGVLFALCWLSLDMQRSGIRPDWNQAFLYFCSMVTIGYTGGKFAERFGPKAPGDGK